MLIDQVIKRKNYEQILYVLRRHPITFVPQIFFLILFVILPVSAFFGFRYFFPEFFANETILVISVLGIATFYLFFLLVFFIHFIDYYLDIWIVTNDRIVDIEQFGLFSRSISEVDLFRIQDVTSYVKGFFPTFFNYGDLHIKTASSNIEIVFKQIRDPNHVREHLIKLSDMDRRHHFSEEIDMA